MHITVIVGGMNEPSNSNYLADTFIDQLRKNDPAITIHKFRLKDVQIEHFNLGFYDVECTMEPDFCIMQDAILESDGLVIATPVWNFGVPAHLKNFIDRMGSFGLDKETRSQGTLDGLPVYQIFTGGAPLPAWKGMMQKTTSFVTEALRYFGASPVGSFFEGKSTQGRGKFGLVVDQRPERLEELRLKADEFQKIVEEYKKTGKAPLQQRTKGAVM